MNKKQADIEASKIFQEHSRKSDEIMRKAKKDGEWTPGLDSNNHLFDTLNHETRTRLKALAEMIDE